MSTIQTRGGRFQTNDENLKNEDFAAALVDSGKAIARNPRDAEAWVNRGVVFSCMGDLSDAVDNYNQALVLKPKMVRAYQSRGGAYFLMGDFVKAIADFTTVIRLDPHNSVGYYNRGIALQKQGDLDQAIADFNQAISLDPKLGEAYHARGRAKLGKGEYADAIADFSRALDLTPQFAAKAYTGRGYVYLASGNYTEAMAEYQRAIAEYKRAIAADPSFASNYFGCANVNVLLGRFDDALADFSKGLKLEPMVKSPRFIYALTLLRLHQAEWPAGLARVVPKWKQEWAKEVGRYLIGELSEADFMALAQQGDEKSVREHSCEAFYYVGMVHLIANESDVARGLFERCLATNMKDFDEYFYARVELARLGDNH